MNPFHEIPPFVRRHRWLPALLAIFVVLPAAWACNIPVFRYALDRWRPDRYELTVLHNQPLSEQEKRLLDKLQEYSDRPDAPANVNLTWVDLSRNHDRVWDKLHESLGQPPLPCLVLRFPDATDIGGPIWTGPVEEQSLQRVLDSPARREISRRIWHGDSAVWVMLESGDAKKDSQAAQVLKKSLNGLEMTLKLPDVTDSPQDKLLNSQGPKMRLAFSLLPISRTDPVEEVLVRMLLRTEDGLLDRKEPMVFPVFGRGIVLHALVGKGITERNIGESAGFLTGACSCQVKRLNPGVDLLMTADWETGAEPERFRLETATPAPTAGTAPSSLPMIRNISLAVLGGFIILGGIAALAIQPLTVQEKLAGPIAMTLRRLILREIGYRKLNFVLAVFSVAVAVASLVAVALLLSLHEQRTEEIIAAKEAQTRAAMRQLEDDYRKITLRLGFNLHILPKSQRLADLYADDAGPVFMPEEYADRLAKSGVATINHVLPILRERVTWEEKKRTILLKGTRGELAILQRQEKKPLRDAVPPGAVVIGHELHRSLGLARGDKITLTLSRRSGNGEEKLPTAEFTVHKLQSPTGTPEDIALWINLAEAQKLLKRPRQISEILALECHCETDRLARIRAEISSILPDTQVIELGPQALARAEARSRAAQEARQAVEREKDHRQNLKEQQEEFATVLVPFVLLGCMIGVGLLAFQNVRDRAAEIGILRALGLGNTQVMSIFFGKAVLVGLAGALAGYGAGALAGILFGETRPSLALLLEPGFLSLILLGTPALCLLMSWFPAREAVRQDPATVLRED